MPTKGERVLADKILNRTVVSKTGKTFGKADDLIFEASSGEIIYLVLREPTPYAQTFDLEKTKDGQFKIPYNCVIAIGDFVVLAEEDIV